MLCHAALGYRLQVDMHIHIYMGIYIYIYAQSRCIEKCTKCRLG